MTDRKFYRRRITVEVLSETPILEVGLSTLHHEITDGSWSGWLTYQPEEELNGRQMALALQKQGSDPAFFHLTKRGEDTET